MSARARTTWLWCLAFVFGVALTLVLLRLRAVPLQVKFLGITNAFGGSRYAVEITNRSNREIYWRIVTGSTNRNSSLGSGLPVSAPFQSGIWRGRSQFNG